MRNEWNFLFKELFNIYPLCMLRIAATNGFVDLCLGLSLQLTRDQLVFVQSFRS
jgi:hypothetical protein